MPHWREAHYKTKNKSKSNEHDKKISSCPSMWSSLLQVWFCSWSGLLCYLVDSRHFSPYCLNYSYFKVGSGCHQFHAAVPKQETLGQYFVFPLYGTPCLIIKSSQSTKSLFTLVSANPDFVSQWAFLDNHMSRLNAPTIFLKATAVDPSCL